VYSALGTEILWDKSSNQKEVELVYHGEESYGKFYLSENIEFLSPSNSIIPIKDSEASQVTSNLIVVGGSCVNTVAAKLIGTQVPLCGLDWTIITGSGENEWLIETYANQYALGKIAVLVAGYETKDTINAVNYLTTNKPDVSIIGTRIEGP